jgi:hypothetical protein
MRIDVVIIGTGLVFLIVGISFGGWVGATSHFQYADAHAHLNLLGFVVPTLYGLIYRCYPNLARSSLVWPQYIGHFVGVLIFVPGLVVVTQTGSPVVLIPGAVLVLLALLSFAFIFFTRIKSD